MKRFRYLVPIGIAAASLFGGRANAPAQAQQAPVTELRNADQWLTERTLLMKVTDQGAIHGFYGTQHVSQVLIATAFLVPRLAGVQSGPDDEAMAPPTGSYRDSCIGVQAWRSVLRDRVGSPPTILYRMRAQCRDRAGAMRGSFLEDYDACAGGIANDDGRLTCPRKPAVLPGGSWRQSCRDGHLRPSDKMMAAECRTMGNQWNFATLQLSADCRNAVNNNGTLSCAGYDLPPGTWGQSCSNAHVDGSKLRANCNDSNQNVAPATELDLSTCHKPVTNLNGYLFCGGWGDLLGGSWLQSCRSMVWDGGAQIYAQCRTSAGGWRDNTLYLSQCQGKGATNNNGVLTCNLRRVQVPHNRLMKEELEEIHH